MTIDAAFERFSRIEDGEPCSFVSVDYTVHHDANYILSLSLRALGIGAYPSVGVANLTIDLRTGERLTANGAFEPSRHRTLQELVDTRAHVAWRRAVSQNPAILRDVPERGDDVVSIDNFLVFSDRVVFVADFGLPHVIAVATPNSELAVRRRSIQPFLRVKGPLNWMTRSK